MEFGFCGFVIFNKIYFLLGAHKRTTNGHEACAHEICNGFLNAFIGREVHKQLLFHWQESTQAITSLFSFRRTSAQQLDNSCAHVICILVA